jgi:hypothetical protein
MAKPKGATSYRFSEDAQRMIIALADHLGVSKTGVLEMAVRKLARSELGLEPLAQISHAAHQGPSDSVLDPLTVPV